MHYAPAPLHIPDGFLNLVISLVFWALTVLFVGLALARTNRALGEKRVPLMGIMAAFIFAAQMLNFPVAGRHIRPLSGRRAGGHRPRPLGGHPGHDGGYRRSGAALSGWRPAGDERQHLQHGHPHRHHRLWVVPRGFVLRQPDAETRRGWPGGLALHRRCCPAHRAATLVERLASRLEIVLPAMLGVHLLIGIGEAPHHGCGAGLHLPHPPRPALMRRKSPKKAARRLGDGGHPALAGRCAALAPGAPPTRTVWSAWPKIWASWALGLEAPTRFCPITPSPGWVKRRSPPSWPVSSVRWWCWG